MHLPRVTSWTRLLIALCIGALLAVIVGQSIGWRWVGTIAFFAAVAWSLSPLNGDSRRY